MEQKTIILTNGQVKGIYEYFTQQLQQEGKTAKFSYFVFKNAESLSEAYNKIVNTIYVEELDTNFQKYKNDLDALLLKYTDRDEQGKPIIIDKQYSITEQIVEFKEEVAKLEEANKEVLANRQQKIQESVKFMQLTVEYSLIVMPIADFPDKTMPAIVGLFGVC